MPFSTNINTYSDVVSVLSAARAAGGAVYELPPKAMARNWVARAYYYRKLLVKAARQRAGNLPGFTPSTDWDDMRLEVTDTNVHITFREVVGVLRNAGGLKLEVPFIPGDRGAAERIITQPQEAPAQPVPDVLGDDLGLEAEDLARRLGIRK
jgi:hypothetical protein